MEDFEAALRRAKSQNLSFGTEKRTESSLQIYKQGELNEGLKEVISEIEETK